VEFISNVPSARYFAVSIPSAVTLNFILIGLGILKDEETIKSMSRTGNPKELLYGPMIYGLIFVYSTIVYWGESPLGITTLMLLCLGDGTAGLFGEHYGRSKLPWNPRKTWVGSISFFISSVLFSSVYIFLFNKWNWFSTTAIQFGPVLIITASIATFIESFPGVGSLDNLTVFVGSIITLKLCGW